ncbi:hypothetical protein [Cellulomonas sp. NS3]|uniref:hypothetical protein n=1 Tax=Cellulomonas sp. NS3 TaxID=2973977 RepID=UPI0021626A8B|nr:hypothetical protein [Cellulomonas sp. NS3]
MFLEMAKDMPRGRSDSLERLWVPLLVVLTVAAVGIGAWFVVDARTDPGLARQVEQQAQHADVLLDEYTLPTGDGQGQVRMLVDGVWREGLVRVAGDVATLLVRDAEGGYVPVDPRR